MERIKTPQNVMKQFECPIHLGVMEDPVSLSCQHNLCRVCCISIMQERRLITCPLCRSVTNFPNGKDSLQVNHQMNAMLQALSQFQDFGIDETQKIKKLIEDTFMNINEKILIKRVEDISTPANKAKFDQAKLQIQGSNEVLLKLHGTYKKNVQGIRQLGFKTPRTFERQNHDQEGFLTFGKAVYLSTYSSKVVNYGDEVIIACDVVLGRVQQMFQSDIQMDSQKAREQGFDTIFFEQNSSNQTNICKGSLTDEYAIYNPQQVFPRFAVYYEIQDNSGVSNLQYQNGSHTLQNTNFLMLVKALQMGAFKNRFAACLIVGDLSRDFTNATVFQINKYKHEFFNGIEQMFQSQNEQLILAAGRVLWNSSYEQKFLQDIIVQVLGVNIFSQLLNYNHQSVEERTLGVIQNLTSLEPQNCLKFAQEGFLEILLKELKYTETNEGCLHLHGSVDSIQYALGAIGNILKYHKLDGNPQLLNKIHETVLPLIDCQEAYSEEAIRIVSNQIGYTQEWVENGYKSSKGLNKI